MSVIGATSPLTKYHWPRFRDLRASGPFQKVAILVYYIGCFEFSSARRSVERIEAERGCKPRSTDYYILRMIGLMIANSEFVENSWMSHTGKKKFYI
jgi:hypothetical protein